MLGLGTLRKDAPLRWAAVIGIRLVLVGVVVLVAGRATYLGDMCMSRRTRAIAEVHEIRKAIPIYITLTGQMPRSLADLNRPLDHNEGESIIEITEDPWGERYGFLLDGPRTITIIGLGADGEFGGEGDDADLVLRWPSTEEVPPR